MSLVVADTSPVNYLLETGYLDLLPKLYRQIILPDSVYRELLAAGIGSIVTEWASALPSWVSVRQPSVILPTSRHLHRGELDAIVLAEEVKAGLVLMDDDRGVQFALERGLIITGTLGVLVEAAQNDLIPIDVALSKLQATDFRAALGLYERARQLALAKPPVPPRRKKE
jgi:predicted nucleic acid-binding protein